jgi:hypothetical protein
MIKHKEKCRGVVNRLQCADCLRVCKSSSNLCVHRKTCKVKKEKEAQALVTTTIADTCQPCTIQNQNNTINNTTNTTNITNNTTNNNTLIQNNTVNLVVFGEEMALLNDHISKQYVKQLLKNKDLTELVNKYSVELLKRRENQCVRKTNLRSASSSVYVGNNKWEACLDHEIYPKLMSNIACNLGDIAENYNVAVRRTLNIFIEDITCNGEHGNSEDIDECKKVKLSYKKLLDSVKHILFNFTKQAIETAKAQKLANAAGDE